jgi:hypothetical protein
MSYAVYKTRLSTESGSELNTSHDKQSRAWHWSQPKVIRHEGNMIVMVRSGGLSHCRIRGLMRSRALSIHYALSRECKSRTESMTTHSTCTRDHATSFLYCYGCHVAYVHLLPRRLAPADSQSLPEGNLVVCGSKVARAAGITGEQGSSMVTNKS